MQNDMSPKVWLADSMMNLLVDYYPEAQARPYGSGVTRENILPVLRELELGYICIYAKGHSGYTTWPSSLKTQHNRLAYDQMKFFREVTKETGTCVVFYFSGLLDGIAALRHPTWNTRTLDDTDQTTLTEFSHFLARTNCPHSEFFDEWVAVQLRELINGYHPDGFWVDGDWSPPCYCSRCRTRFRDELGWTESWADVRQRSDFTFEYGAFWNRVLATWRARCNNFIKSLDPNCAYSAGNVSPRREFLAPFDWRSGDFFSPMYFNLCDIARMMRWYSTLGVPYDAYVCDTSFTHSRMDVRSRSKSLDRMLQESAIVAVNGGAVGYWTYPLGDGALVPSRMKKAAAVRRFLKEREDLFLHSQSLGWTGIIITDPSTPAFGCLSAEGAHKALAALHLSPEISDETIVTDNMPYDLLVFPEQCVLDEQTAQRLITFVERGGMLLTSGASIESPYIQKLLGVNSVRRGEVKDGHVVLKSCDEPTGIDSGWDRLTLDGASELYPLYLSWDQLNPENRHISNNWPMHGQLDEVHPEPAGFPAAITRKVGKGQVVHICTDIFTVYRRLGDVQMLRWLREIITDLLPTPYFETDAPSWVDVSLRRKDGGLLIHLVNCNSGRDVMQLRTDDLWVDEIPTIGPITCKVRGEKPKNVTLEPGAQTANWSWENGILTITVPQLSIHRCIKVQK